jgi:O-antigen/teichoic acid export membrane protein
MAKYNSLKCNFYWTLCGNFIYALSQWGILILLAKLGSPILVGKFALALAICTPITIFSQLQLRGLQVTDVRDEYGLGHYLALRYITVLFSIMITAIVAFSFYKSDVWLLIFFVSISQGIESIRDLFYGFMQKNERMDFLSLGQVIVGISNFIGFGLVIYLTQNLALAIFVTILLRVVVIFAYDIFRVKSLFEIPHNCFAVNSLKPIYDFKTLWRLTRQALPLGIVMVIISVETNIPRYFLEGYLGIKILGFFSALAALLQIGTLIIGALGQSAAPRLARYYQENFNSFKCLVLKLQGIGLIVGIFCVLLAVVGGRFILTILYTSEYTQYNKVLIVLMIAGGFTYISSFLGYALTASRHLKVQVPINVCVLIVTLIGSWYFIKHYGLIGAAITLVCSAFVRLVIQRFVLFKNLKKQSMLIVDN